MRSASEEYRLPPQSGDGPPGPGKAQEAAQDQIAAQQRFQRQEIPAVEDVLQPQRRNPPGRFRAVGPDVCHGFLPLGNQRSRQGKRHDQRQQQHAEAHGPQKRKNLFHSAASPGSKTPKDEALSFGAGFFR